MPFEVVEKRQKPGRSSMPVTISLTCMGNAPRPALRVGLSKDFVGECGLGVKDRFELAVGTGEHAGLIRLKKVDGGPFEPRLLKGGMLVDCGFVPQLGTAARSKLHCEARRVDTATVEITLPTWEKDEERGPAPAPSPVDMAASRDRAHRAIEHLRTLPSATPAQTRPLLRNNGISVSLAPPLVTHGRQDAKLTEFQAIVLAPLVVASPGVVPPKEIIARGYRTAGKTPGASAVALLTSEMSMLTPLLKKIGIRLQCVRGVGYSVAPIEG